ncbi:DUF7455 domain-containing protein [Arcanobacterium hippocoleae]|uniref:DUF7455 domain-containing protein n=1 Tax=Arcanobacterium hippocoleae TaxID=149017 RepID=UPI0033403E7D
MESSNQDTYKLTTLDRCDACGAQAYVRAQMPFGVLLFCAHHAKKYQEKISQLATSVLDETYRIQA